MADTVLIVDDDEAVLTMLYKVIRSNGIEADTVAFGEEALERTAQRTYDLILLDVNLMGMDGFQAVSYTHLTRVRKSPTPMVTEAARSASPALPSSVTAIPVASATVLPVT